MGNVIRHVASMLAIVLLGVFLYCKDAQAQEVASWKMCISFSVKEPLMCDGIKGKKMTPEEWLGKLDPKAKFVRAENLGGIIKVHYTKTGENE